MMVLYVRIVMTKQNKLLKKEIDQLKRKNAKLRKRIKELEERLQPTKPKVIIRCPVCLRVGECDKDEVSSLRCPGCNSSNFEIIR